MKFFKIEVELRKRFTNIIRRLKVLIKYAIYNIIDILVIPSRVIKPKTLLLIRLDAIGDYILFRNFIEVLRTSSKYNDYKITLVGNVLWRDLAEQLDSEYVDNFIWIDMRRFNKNVFYRFKKLKEVTKQGYEIVINPTFSRTFYGDDNIVKVVFAKEKIGSLGDFSNIEKWQKRISDKFYTKLIPTKNEIIFEFSRNKEYFESLLDMKLYIKKPFIRFKSQRSNIELPEKYAILFIGATSYFRKWNVKNFVELGRSLRKEYGYKIVLCGGRNDIEDANKFRKLADYEYIDLVGKTSLVDLIFIICNGELIISNDTSAPHIAVALGKRNIFVISNGNHFGRFVPYPREVWPYYYAIFPSEIEKNLNDYEKLTELYGMGSKLDINNIRTEDVLYKIRAVIERNTLSTEA